MAREQGLASQFASDAAAIRAIYDDWSDTYNTDLDDWGYEAPDVAAALLATRVSSSAQVLDVGCGTGKVGVALNKLGFHDVVGIDLSSTSLDVAAQTGCYRALGDENLTELPTTLADDTFSALVCVGVMTYLPDVEAVCREFVRVVEPHGTIVMTQRSDLFTSRNTQAAFDALAADGSWNIIDVSDGRPYLPGHDEYQGIDVHYGVFEKQPA